MYSFIMWFSKSFCSCLSHRYKYSLKNLILQQSHVIFLW
jgi:hypothetical protein